MNASTFLNSWRTRFRKTPEEPKATLEQLKEQIDLAEEYDRLVAQPGWEKILTVAVDNMNGELFEGRKHWQDPAKQTHHVTRYYAKQDLISAIEGHIVSVQNTRDSIVEEFKERANVNNASSNDGN